MLTVCFAAADLGPQTLLKLLKTGCLQKTRSVIAYCAFTAQADQAARFLSAQGISALSYHAQKPHQVHTCPAPAVFVHCETGLSL